MAEHVNRCVPAGESAREAHLVTNILQKYVLQLGTNNGASLSERALRGGPWGWGARSLGTLEDMLRKALDMGISLHRGPFTTEGNLKSGGGGGSYTGDFEDEQMRALGMGHPSARNSMKGPLMEGSFTGDSKRYVKQGSEMGVCFHRGPPFGERGGAHLS